MSGLADIRIFDAADVARAAPYADLVDALHAGHRRPAAVCERIVYGPADTDEKFMALPAWEAGEAIGIKLATIFPDNPTHGRPSVQAVVMLFDGETGAPLALIDGTELTYRKTAADSALGARFLARHDARTLLMVGAGGMAPHLIAAHRAVRPTIERVLVWNRTLEKADRLVAAGIADEVVADLEIAAREADVISTATMAKDPLICGEWLQPGTHVDCVGAYLPDHREVDERAVVIAELFVDSRVAAIEEGGDLVIPIAAGVIDESHVRADLTELCLGSHPGRSGPEAITMFQNGGGGHLDLIVAQHVWNAR